MENLFTEICSQSLPNGRLTFSLLKMIHFSVTLVRNKFWKDLLHSKSEWLYKKYVKIVKPVFILILVFIQILVFRLITDYNTTSSNQGNKNATGTRCL